MKTTFAVLIALSLTTLLTSAPFADEPAEKKGADTKPPETRRVDITGLITKLIPEYRAQFYSSKSPESPAFSTSVDAFPVEADAAKFGAAFIDIEDESGERALAVLFSRPLFKDDGDIELKLARPTLQTKVSLSQTYISVHHFAWLAPEIGYATMPRWDGGAERVVAAENPLLEIRREGVKEPVVSRRLEGGCLGYGWVSVFPLPRGIEKGARLTITVTHDTGELFGKLSTKETRVVE